MEAVFTVLPSYRVPVIAISSKRSRGAAKQRDARMYTRLSHQIQDLSPAPDEKYCGVPTTMLVPVCLTSPIRARDAEVGDR